MNRFILYFFFVSFSFSVYAQEEYGYGILLDSALYVNTPTAAPLMRGDYDGLPKMVSLKQYSPTPGNQGRTSTCAGWAAAYGGRTILDAIKHHWNKKTIDSNSYSPSFVYNQLRTNISCDGGILLNEAIDVLKKLGSIKLNEFGFDCNREVTEQEKIKAKNYRIIEYRDISSGRSAAKVQLTKKSLAENNIVIIAFDCSDSFKKTKRLFKADSSEYKYWGKGHALAVIGYDDNKYGGAFEIMNSWGTNWGNKGYFWITYSDYQYFCKVAFELIDKDIPDQSVYDLSGKLSFLRSDGEPMKVKQSGEYFVMENSYTSGTVFQLRMSNDEPAYVYAFSTDLTNKTVRIFPFDNRMTAYLPYSKNNLAIPDEDNFNMLDTVTGKSYYCFLYSREELDIDTILLNIENAKGSIWERIKSVLGNSIVLKENSEFNLSESVLFKAKSNGHSVIPILIEINHY